MSRLRLPGPPPLQGGTLDLELDGSWDGGRIGYIDLPLRVTLRDTVLSMEGIKPTRLDELVLPIGISGPIDSPRIRFEHSVLVDALVDAGKRELANQVQSRLEGEVTKQLDELTERAGIEIPDGLEIPDDAKGLFDGFLGGGKKKEKKDGPR